MSMKPYQLPSELHKRHEDEGIAMKCVPAVIDYAAQSTYSFSRAGKCMFALPRFTRPWRWRVKDEQVRRG